MCIPCTPLRLTNVQTHGVSTYVNSNLSRSNFPFIREVGGGQLGLHTYKHIQNFFGCELRSTQTCLNLISLYRGWDSGVDPGFGQGGPQLPRLKVADIVKQSPVSEVSYLQPEWALEAFEFLMLKYIFSHILDTLFLSFLTSRSRPKTPKI